MDVSDIEAALTGPHWARASTNTLSLTGTTLCNREIYLGDINNNCAFVPSGIACPECLRVYMSFTK